MRSKITESLRRLSISSLNKRRNMRDFKFSIPTSINFGKDSLSALPAELAKLGAKRVMICYGSDRIKQNGLLSQVESLLDKNDIDHIQFGGVKANPRYSHALKGVEIAKEYRPDCMLAIGGGSVIDTAKAIAIGAVNEGDLWDIWCYKIKETRALKVGCILTIPAAGSETSDSAVLTNDFISDKRGHSSDKFVCSFAIMNPEYAMTLPNYQIACGVVDIMMHTLDRYFYKPDIQHNAMTDNIAEALLKNVIEQGKKAYSNCDYESMSELMWAGSLSHNNLTGLGGGREFAVHQLGHELSAMFDVAHGASLSAMWGHWARYVLDKDVARFVRYAQKVWNIEGEGRETALKGIEATENYFRSLDMPVSLVELVGKQNGETLKTLANKCSRNGSRVVGEFSQMDEDILYGVYKSANE